MKRNLPACIACATELGMPDLFHSDYGLERALSLTLKVIEYRAKHGRYPPIGSEKRLNMWLRRMRRAKKGNHGKAAWYQECEQLAITHGYPDMFLYPSEIAIPRGNWYRSNPN